MQLSGAEHGLSDWVVGLIRLLALLLRDEWDRSHLQRVREVLSKGAHRESIAPTGNGQPLAFSVIVRLVRLYLFYLEAEKNFEGGWEKKSLVT